MTKLRSLEEFSNFLDGDIAWRKKEIADLWTLVESRPNVSQSTIIRAAIALLYAHWEGFVKTASEGYLQYLSEQVRRRKIGNKLAAHFQSLCLWKSIRSEITQYGGEMNRPSQFVRAMKSLMPIDDHLLDLPHENVINTESNLNSIVLRDILAVLDLSYVPFAAKEKLIDQHLLATRNQIVHGGAVRPSREDFQGIESEILSLLAEFKSLLEQAATGRSYMRAV